MIKTMDKLVQLLFKQGDEIAACMTARVVYTQVLVASRTLAQVSFLDGRTLVHGFYG